LALTKFDVVNFFCHCCAVAAVIFPIGDFV